MFESQSQVVYIYKKAKKPKKTTLDKYILPWL